MTIESKMVTIEINGHSVMVPKGTTILDAAKKLEIHIPTLCHLNLENLGFENNNASCRVCVVEIEGKGTLVPACATEVTDGMKIRTDSLEAITARRMSVELLLSNHPNECFTCPKNLDCELQALAHELGVRDIKWTGRKYDYEMDDSSGAIVKNPNKCIMCRRCETMCNEVQTRRILSAMK